MQSIAYCQTGHEKEEKMEKKPWEKLGFTIEVLHFQGLRLAFLERSILN